MLGRHLTINFVRFTLVLIVQIFVLNNIQLFGWASPMVYPFLILLLPIGVPPSIVMLISFFTGLLIDVFSNGGGIHTASLTAMGFFRKPLLGQLMPQSGYEKEDLPTFNDQGLGWFLMYSGILLGLHHLMYFLLEEYSFRSLGYTILRTFTSAIVSMILFWMINLSALPKKKKLR